MILIILIVLLFTPINASTSINKKIITADSAVIISPKLYSQIKGEIPYIINLKCNKNIKYIDMYVKTYPFNVDTLARIKKPPFKTIFNPQKIQDQDQISFQLGYTIYLSNGDTIVSPPFPHKWVISRKKILSNQKIKVKQLKPNYEIIIDGAINDWNAFNFIKLSETALFSCTWTPTDFFIAVKVHDTTICEDDKIEIRFDMYKTKNVFMNINQREISFGPQRRRSSIAVSLNEKSPIISDSIEIRIRDEIKWRCKIKNNGYIIESRIPFRLLSDIEFPPAKFGFDITVIDAKYRHDKNPIVISWSHAIASARKMPYRWGTIELKQIMLPLKLFFIFSIIIIIMGIGLIFLLSIQQWQTHLKENPKENNSFINSIISILENDYNKNITEKIIAEKLNVSTNVISNEINKELNTTFDNLLEQIRIKKSKQLLNGTNIPNEIYKLIGFKSKYIFEKAFTKYVGISPDEFRKHRIQDILDEEDELI